MRLRGVRRYPKMIKPVAPTKHKYGADVTWSAHTDTYKPTLMGHGVDAEINAFKYNLALTTLIAPVTDEIYEKELINLVKTGRVRTGLYLRPADPLQAHIDFHKMVSGKYASFWSYQGGNRQHDAFVLANSLVSRISAGGETGYAFKDRLSHRLATVFNYDIRDHGMAQALETAEQMLQTTIDSGGWYNDFSHWHWAEDYGDKDQIEQFLSSQRTILNTVNSVTLSASEAIEYMWVRQQFKRGGLYQDGTDLVVVCDVLNEDNVPYQTIDTELSLEVDLTNTTLAGFDVSATSDVLKVSANKYIVQVPYNHKDGFRTVRLKASSEPNYLDLSLPIITNIAANQNTLNVKTDKPTKAVLFAVPRNGKMYQAEIVKRSHKLQTGHVFNVTNHSKDYYVGVITGANQSVLSDKFVF